MREAAQPVSGKTDWNADWRPVAQRVDGCALTVIRFEIETIRETLISFQPLGRNMIKSSWSCCYPFVGRSDTREFIEKTVST